jgi:hypothetical protein
MGRAHSDGPAWWTNEPPGFHVAWDHPSILKELSVYLTGWRGYFDFYETPSVLRDLDQWTRRRLRAIAWIPGRTFPPPM